jgi:LCP family protein required for cell wall assembly
MKVRFLSYLKVPQRPSPNKLTNWKHQLQLRFSRKYPVMKKERHPSHKTLAIIIFLLCTTFQGCSRVSSQVLSPQTHLSKLVITANPNAVSTATPFQPAAPTPSATFFPTTTNIPPQETPAEEPPPQLSVAEEETISIPPDRRNILLLGSDYRPGGGYRTDVILLVSINPVSETVSIISFPRDLYIIIPGWGYNRINVVMSEGGFDLLAETFAQNFGIRPDSYIMTNFDGFVAIIDTMDGIDVEVGQSLTDVCDLPENQMGFCTVDPGNIQMYGQTALWYVRSRYTSNDFDRNRRQQEVVYGIFNKLMHESVIQRLPELYGIFRDSVETNLELEDVAILAQLAPQLAADTGRIHQYSIGSSEVWDYYAYGASVLLPNQPAILDIINQAVNQ